MSTANKPAGMPASSARTPRARADRGVSSAGLTTQVHPAAKAAATCKKNQDDNINKYKALKSNGRPTIINTFGKIT